VQATAPTNLISTTQNHDPAHHATAPDGPKDDHKSIERRETRQSRVLRSLFGLLAKHSRLHALALELSSLRWRMEFQQRLHTHQIVVDLGFAVEKSPNGHSRPNRRTHARIQGIESFVATCPKATLFERWVFLLGWNAAEAFASRSSGTKEMDEAIQT
jgi:hypothetical protein